MALPPPSPLRSWSATLFFKRRGSSLLAFGLLAVSVSYGHATPPSPSSASAPLEARKGEIEALLDLTDDLNRGRSSHSELVMKVKTARYEREMTIEAWSEGAERSLLRILSPKRDAGVATLKVGDEAWNYLPKIDRTLKISASAMGGAWMGSHLTNDDLIKGSRMRRDYTWALMSRPTDSGEGRYQIELTPKPDVPVVWGRLTLYISADKRPERVEYWNERGRLQRVMSFHDYRELDGRAVPMRMRVTPKNKEGELTELIYTTLDFNVSLPPRTFSLQSLKR